MGAVAQGARDEAADPEGGGLQRDHRADRGHGPLHLSLQDAAHPPEGDTVCRADRNGQERLPDGGCRNSHGVKSCVTIRFCHSSGDDS